MGKNEYRYYLRASKEQRIGMLKMIDTDGNVIKKGNWFNNTE